MSFEWKKFSQKQMQIWRWWWPDSPYRNCDGIIADGAIRSGKTIVMAPSFVQWAMMNYSGQCFAICGKTIGALRRNVITTLKEQLIRNGMSVVDLRSENTLTVTLGRKSNTFYLFGGKDESSADLIQGVTLAGIYFDEVALMPRSFVEKAEGRCSVEGARFWYTCNPEGPSHWFKHEYINVAAEKRLFYAHFVMDDNLTLSRKTKERYKRQFTGVFYQRAILGLWVAAEGRIYTQFSDDLIISEKDWRSKDDYDHYISQLHRNIAVVTLGIDFGGNKSYHAFNLTGFTKGFRQLITLKDRRIQGDTPDALEKAFVQFVLECQQEYPQLHTVYCDSAEQVLIRGLKKAARDAKLAVQINNASKCEIIDRIRFYCMMQGSGRYFILAGCKETIKAFNEAVWDPDAAGDVRLDDGTTNIDNLDAQEYSSEPFMRAMIDIGGK